MTEQPKTEQTEKLLQWHPAFFAGTQIELKEEAEHLIFENEHPLGTKPMQIDILIIRKEDGYPIKKNIGQIFRTYNIWEYKSPTDYLSIDDFYKVYGYACFYKADTGRANSIPMEEITISFACSHYPKKLIRYLKQDLGYRITRKDPGIYYVIGDNIPIQIIVTTQLSPDKNLWLRGLNSQLPGMEFTNTLLGDYHKNKQDHLYRSVMNMIVRANQETFEEEKDMCEELMNLFKDELEEARAASLAEGRTAGMAEGRAVGLAEGLTKANHLYASLLNVGRNSDVLRAITDPSYLEVLFAEFGI